MVRNDAMHPRWVQRRDERRAGRYDGDKVIRWIARPTLTKGRTEGPASSEAEDDAPAPAEQRRRAAFGRLRIVSERGSNA